LNAIPPVFFWFTHLAFPYPGYYSPLPLSPRVSVGIAASACGGFLEVCCVKPATVNRWLGGGGGKGNDITGSGHAHFGTEKSPVVNDAQCGIRPSTVNRRVIDGEDAGFGTFPWQALVRIGKAKCGGVLGK
jgi:hypothetical protein